MMTLSILFLLQVSTGLYFTPRSQVTWPTTHSVAMVPRCTRLCLNMSHTVWLEIRSALDWQANWATLPLNSDIVFVWVWVCAFVCVCVSSRVCPQVFPVWCGSRCILWNLLGTAVSPDRVTTQTQSQPWQSHNTDPESALTQSQHRPRVSNVSHLHIRHCHQGVLDSVTSLTLPLACTYRDVPIWWISWRGINIKRTQS